MDYPKDVKFARYFFREHSFDELEEWTRSLHFFRYCRAIGGHANDFDTLRCALRIEGEEDLVDLCQKLGFPLRELPAPLSLPEGAQPSGAAPSPIAAFPRLEEPKKTEVAGVHVFVSFRSARIDLELWGIEPYSIGIRDVENARRVEEVLMPLLPRLIDPPVEGERCFTK